MNFTSDTRLYLGLFQQFKRERLKDKICFGNTFMKIYVRKHSVILLLFSYSSEIQLNLHFEVRGTIFSTILTSREELSNHFCNSMPFRNYNIWTYN